MLGGADNPNGELPSYITGADIIIRANQVSVDRDMVTQQSVGNQAFTAAKVFT